MTTTLEWHHGMPAAADVRLVVSDLDGTLLTDDGRVPASFWPLLSRMRGRGITFVPASGRQHATLTKLFGNAHEGMSYIAENGASIVHQGQALPGTFLSPATVDRVRSTMRENDGLNAGLVVCGATTAYVERHDEAFLEEVRKYYASLEVVDDLTPYTREVLKLAVFTFRDAETDALPLFATLPDDPRVVVSGEHWLDVMHRNINKGVAVRRLQEILGVSRDQTAAFGDYLNDLEMLDAAEHSFAMANAHPKTRARARMVAPSNRECGVVSVLTQMLNAHDPTPAAAPSGGLRWVEREDAARKAETMTDNLADRDASKARPKASKKPSRSTIQDVADRAGVTKSTVSKYLNAQSAGYYVSARTRERIEAAIESLRFEPNLIAKGLTQNRTMTIGLIAADIRNPFYPDLVAGVQDVVEEAGYTLLLGSSNSDPEREIAITRSMIRRQVDGVILGSARMQAEDIESLMESGMRFVLASRDLPNLVTDSVTVDNRAGAELAVDHLVELGHRVIAHVAGPQDVVPFRDRLWGYRHALIRHDIDPDDSLAIMAKSSAPEAGAAAARALLTRATRPTAVFMANDNMALGAMDAARQLGLQIPEDISIVGFDNIALAANSFIGLTSVDSRASELGAHAATLLLERLKAGDVPPYDDLRTVVQRPILRVRNTTAAPATQQ